MTKQKIDFNITSHEDFINYMKDIDSTDFTDVAMEKLADDAYSQRDENNYLGSGQSEDMFNYLLAKEGSDDYKNAIRRAVNKLFGDPKLGFLDKGSKLIISSFSDLKRERQDCLRVARNSNGEISFAYDDKEHTLMLPVNEKGYLCLKDTIEKVDETIKNKYKGIQEMIELKKNKPDLFEVNEVQKNTSSRGRG